MNNIVNPARLLAKHVALATAVASVFGVTNSARVVASTYDWATPSDGPWSTGFVEGAPPSDPTTQLIFIPGSYSAINDLASPFTLNSETFNNSSPTNSISCAGFNTLSFAGTNPAITVNEGQATIVSQIAINTGLSVANNGGGLLTLNSILFGTNTTTNISSSGAGGITITDSYGTGPVFSGTNDVINFSNTGTGTVAFGNIAAISGTININAGAVTFAGNTAGDLFGNSLILNVAAGASYNFANNPEGMGGVTGTGTIILGTAGLSFAAPGNRTFSGTMTGTGTITQNNLYTFSLGAANALSPNSLLSVAAGTVDLGGFNQAVAGLTGGNQNGTLPLGSSTLTLAPVAGANYVFDSGLTGAGNVVFNGPGNQNLVGVNSYTGTTTVTGGTLRLNNPGPLNVASVAANATLDLILPNAANGNLLTGAGSLVKEGAGNLTFSASNGFTPGNLTVAVGTVTIDQSADNGSKLGTGTALTMAGGLVVLNGNAAGSTQTFASTSLGIGASGVQTTANGSAATINLGAITPGYGGSLNVIVSGTGAAVTTTTANTTNTLGGFATVNGAGWAVAGTGGTATAITALPQASYTANTFTAGTHTDITSSYTVATSAASTGDVRFNTAAATTLTLKGVNVITNGGILVTPAVGANTTTIANGTSTSMATPANQDLFLQQFNTAGTLAISANISNTVGTAATATGNIATTANQQTLTLSAPPTIPIKVGELVTDVTDLVAPGGAGILPAVDNATVVAVNSPTSVTIAYATAPGAATTGANLVFTPGTDVVKSGPGTLRLTGANSFKGVLALNQGLTVVGAASNLGSTGSGSSSIYFNGGTLEATAGITSSTGIQAWIVGPGGATINVDSGLTITKTGNTFFGNGDVTLNGPGTFGIGSNGSTFTGRFFVNSGSFRLTSNQVANSTGVTIANGAQFYLLDTTSGPFNLYAGTPLILNGNGPANGGAFLHTLDEAGSANYAFNSPIILASTSRFTEVRRINTAISSGFDTTTDILPDPVTGPGSLIKDGDGTLVLSNPNNTYGGTNGQTIVSNGLLQLGVTNGVPTGSTLQFGETGSTNSGTFDLKSFNQTVAAITTAGPGTAPTILNSSTSAASTLTVTYNGTTPDVAAVQIGSGTPGATAGNNLLLVKSGTGTLVLAGINTYTGDTTVNGGGLVVGPVGTLAGNLIVNAGGNATFAAPTGSGILVRTVGNLTVNTGGSLAVAPTNVAANRALLLTPSLTVAAAATMDLSDNDLDVQNGNLTAVTGLVRSGYNLAGGANFAGPGIVSSTAAANGAHDTTLGVVVNSDAAGNTLFGGAGQRFFDGTSPAAADVLVKYTYFGDANLDGVVDGSDYTRIDNSFNTETATPGLKITGWYNGDFNYDGVVDGSDYTLIDDAFNTQGGTASPNAGGLFAGSTDQIVTAAAVPEPATAGFIALVAAALLGRRRR